MKKIKFNNSKGSAMTIVFIVLVVVTIAIVAFVFISDSSKKEEGQEKEEKQKKEEGQEKEEKQKKEERLRKVTIGDIKFELVNAVNLGNILKAPVVEYNGQYMSQGENLTTTDKFIKVTIGVRNMGTTDISGGWNIGELVDGEGRVFDESQEASAWLPEKDDCGALLKPGFTPTKCTKIYEVAKISKNMKVKVMEIAQPAQSGAQPTTQPETNTDTEGQTPVQPQQESYIYIGF